VAAWGLGGLAVATRYFNWEPRTCGVRVATVERVYVQVIAFRNATESVQSSEGNRRRRSVLHHGSTVDIPRLAGDPSAFV
jgi:hypothetical protein